MDMTKGRLGKVIRQLNGVLDPTPDGQLLERFLTTKDEAAFETLVRRHGPMVLGVCRRVLGHLHDAEDAFQATFLVLARRAGSVRRCGSLGNFLYGVAHRTALQARRAALRRRAHEAKAMPRPQTPDDAWDGLREALDLELQRLPEKYRSAVVLCDLEGRPRKEAARQLGLPESTLASRLATARRTLARRLTRRGLTLSGGALAAALAQKASAAVPAVLVSSTVEVAAAVAAGSMAAAATPAAALMNEVHKAMLISKLKVYVATAVVAVALGAGGLAYRASGQDVPADRKGGARPPSEMELLRKEMEILKLQVELLQERVRAQGAELRALQGRGAAVQGAAVANPDAVMLGRGQGGPMVAPQNKLPQMAPPPVAGQKVSEEPLRAAQDAGLAPLNELPVMGRLFNPVAQCSDVDKEIEQAYEAFRKAPGGPAKQRAAEALEKALKKLRQSSPPAVAPRPAAR
jgi:RNA polymerase sigma factor (sigma-70 family)